jgi:hypothetical protein
MQQQFGIVKTMVAAGRHSRLSRARGKEKLD